MFVTKPSVTADQAVQLFKMYEDKGWAVKQQVTTFATWLTPIVVSLIGLSFARYGVGDELGRIASIVSLLSSIFMCAIVFGSLKHAEADYGHAEVVREQAADTLKWWFLRKPTRDNWIICTMPFFKLGFRYIGGVHLLIMWVALLLVIVSFVFTTWSLFAYAEKKRRINELCRSSIIFLSAPEDVSSHRNFDRAKYLFDKMGCEFAKLRPQWVNVSVTR